MEVIIEVTCSRFKVSRADFFCGQGKARNIAICLSKKNNALRNWQIGELFGNIRYSAVGRVYERLSRRAVKNNELKKRFQISKRPCQMSRAHPDLTLIIAALLYPMNFRQMCHLFEFRIPGYDNSFMFHGRGQGKTVGIRDAKFGFVFRGLKN